DVCSSDLSGIGAACGSGSGCRFDVPKYKPARNKTDSTAIPPKNSGLLLSRFPEVTVVLGCADGSWSRCATSVADCGRRDGSFARQDATTSSQIRETDAGSISNSFRRSVIEGAIRSQICRSMLPE